MDLGTERSASSGTSRKRHCSSDVQTLSHHPHTNTVVSHMILGQFPFFRVWGTLTAANFGPGGCA